MEDGQRWGIVVSADKKVLEDSTEVEREWVVPICGAGEVAEAR